MSATNTTTNYNLPIFIETDKPAWLVDFNGAMRSIDAQMKTNADAIATKSPILTFNDTADIDFTKSGDIITANLSSGVAGTVSRALVKPVSAPASTQIASVDSSNNQQMLNLGTGLAVESGTLNAIDLNLTNRGLFTMSKNVAAGTLSGAFNYATNSGITVGKIYGAIGLNGGTSGVQYVVTLSGCVLPQTEEGYTIYPAGIAYWGGTTNTIVYLAIGANGIPQVVFNTAGANGTILLFPSLYFFEDFGDTPTP